MSKLLVMIVGIACAAAVAAAEGQPPRKVWTARDVIIAQGGVPPEDMPAAQATPGEPAAPAAAPAKAKGKKAKAAAKAKKKKVAAKGAKKRPAKRAKGRG